MRIWEEEDLLEIERLYVEDGLKTVDIGKIYKTKRDTISELLKSRGVPINIASKNRMFNHDFFEIIDTEDKAYFLGLLTADGNVSLDSDKDRNRSPMIRLELIDKDVLEEFRNSTKMSAEIKTSIRKDRNVTYVWSIRSKKMAEDLYKLGIIPDKTKLMFSVNTKIREDLKRHYVRGLVDGDGSIYYSKNSYHVSFTTKHREFAESVQDIFMELTGKKNVKKITCCNDVHKITYSGKDAVKLCEALYLDSNFSINRKKELADKVMSI